MGWLYGWFDRKSMVAHLLKGEENEHTKFEKIANAFTGNNMWVVWERTMKKDNTVYRFIALYMMNRMGQEGDPCHWGYKDIDESMGPCQVNCPMALLQLAPLTPTTEKYDYAVQWRKDVEGYWNQRKLAAEYAKTMKRGQVFTAHGREYTFHGLYKRDYVLAYRVGGFSPYRIKKTAIAIPEDEPVLGHA